MDKTLKTVDIYDSTLRDGAQSEGISFSVQDKINIVKSLDAIGIKYIEAGNPFSNPKDLEFFAEVAKLRLQNATIVAFGSTRRKNIKAEDDPNVTALMTANTSAVAVFGKSWDLHATDILNTTLEENLCMIHDTCRYFKENGKHVIFDAEHFFDGYKRNPDYALKSLEAAVKGGADCIALCDTNGVAFPDEIFEITGQMVERFQGVSVGIHCHNDCGMAVSNSVMAVKAGATQVQGTYLGFGERCGNANLSTIIPNLQIKSGYSCIPQENLANLTGTAREIAEISNISIKKYEPYIGTSAFAHKAGMHADGVLKNSQSFEHIDPELVGNERRFLISEMSGRNAVLQKIKRVFPDIKRDSEETALIIGELKNLEHQGYQFEGADASIELIVRKKLGLYRPTFNLISYKILAERPYDNGKSATATIKICVEDKLQITAAEGNGPVNALDQSLREALAVFYPEISKVHLIDYKVRVMDSKEATATKVRVLITSTDGQSVWSTVGVSSDIIEASWIALVDSIEYKLLK